MPSTPDRFGREHGRGSAKLDSPHGANPSHGLFHYPPSTRSPEPASRPILLVATKPTSTDEEHIP